VNHLLVTNDFPPKVGGIQSYLWELWRRLPPGETTVLTTPYAGSASFDREQAFRVERTRERMLLPTKRLAAQIDRLAAAVDASLVLLDPAWPLGVLGPGLERPYAVVVHGAEVTVPARTPVVRHQLRRALSDAALVVAAGGYPAVEAERLCGRRLPAVVIPPGVDVERFVVLDADARRRARSRFGMDADGPVVLSVSRLVPRKGMDVLIEAAAGLRASYPDLGVAIAGDGRDHGRLERRIERTGAPVRLLGRVGNEDLPDLYGCVDVFAMPCRNRWRGVEQEGFGIVFLEAAACGIPQVAGRSGGSHEAVEHGITGLVVDDPRSVEATRSALDLLLGDDVLRARLGAAARQRVEDELTYDVLAERLRLAIASVDATGGDRDRC
jgi:phosphatidyl-myo-inositol dimannoside synthase